MNETQISQEMQSRIDREIKRILDEGYKKAVAILKKYKSSLDKVAEALIKKETLEGEDFEKLLSFSKPAIATVKS